MGSEEDWTGRLLLKLSKKIDVSLYSANDLSIHLGLGYEAGSNQKVVANMEGNPQAAHFNLLQQFKSKTGLQGLTLAQKLIEIFEANEKGFLVKSIKKAIDEREHATIEVPPVDSYATQGPSQTQNTQQVAIQITQLPEDPPNLPREDSSWNKLHYAFAGIVVFVAIAAGIYFARPGEKLCSPNPCLNGGSCNELDGSYSCTCKTEFGGDNCQIEYVAEDLTLEECQETLRNYYKRSLFDIHIKPWDSDDYVDLKNYFTTVSLYKEDKNLPNIPLQKLILNGSINDIFQTKIREKLPERIVMFGEAGHGKTTAVAKMAYDWVFKTEESPLKNLPLLFVFKMRNMNENTGIGEAVVELLGINTKYQTPLEYYIDKHEKDIVMLFDGYDEFSGQINGLGGGGGVMDILRYKRCRICRVLITSRPFRINDFNSRDHRYSKMVIKGYSQQHAADFIDKFFISDEQKGKELQKYLKEDIVTNEMIATPLFCTMVCYLWNDRDREGYIQGKFTRTKLFDDIMMFLRTHLNAKKHEQDSAKINQGMLNETLVSVGQVAYTKLSNKGDGSPLLLSEDDFSEVPDEKVNISYSLGLLTKSKSKEMKTDADTNIIIEFFHKLAQEYSAGRYLARILDEDIISTTSFSELAFDLKEIFQFASGTSDSACRKILESVLDRSSCGDVSHHAKKDYLYHPLILDFVSETATCAEQSNALLTRFFQDGKLQLRQVTASTVVGFEKLPGSVKEKITTIDIAGTDSSPDLFVRLWNNMHTCNHMTQMEMYRHVPPTISSDMKPLYSVNSFTTSIQPPADDYVGIMTYLPNIQELIIYCDDFGDDFDFALTSDVFIKLWNQLNSSSSLLTRLVTPIPSDVTSGNMKPLTSIRVFESDHVVSMSSFAHVLNFLPKLRELYVLEKEPLELNYNIDAFCKLWTNLHTSSDLNRLLLPIPTCFHCNLKPLRSVQVLETKSTSTDLPTILINLPNLHTLLLHWDIPGYPEMDLKRAHKFFVYFWEVLQAYHQLQHLKLNIPYSVPSLLIGPLRTVTTFETKIKSQMEVFPILLSKLPNVTELGIWASNNYDRKSPENVYYDQAFSAIVDGLVKTGITLQVLNITFDPQSGAMNTVSRDSVEKFIKLLKKDGTLWQLDIISFNYCVFNESSLLEIIKAMQTLASIQLFRLDCSFEPEGEITQYAIQHDLTMVENEEINIESKQSTSGLLKLVLFYWDTETYSRTERSFILPLLH